MLIDTLGYVAAGAVLATFSVRAIKTLRVLAIISNLLFIAYAMGANLPPVLALHILLLPLNVLRLREVMTGNPQVNGQ
jgi:CRP/FNR family transcriptional regulator, cyclic AMP receptor protein